MSIPGTLRDSEAAASANRAAIQARLDSGEIADLGGGKYYIDSPLVVKHRLVGVNPIATVLQQIKPDQDAVHLIDGEFVTIEALGIAGPSYGTGIGIHATSPTHPTCDYLTFRNLQVRCFGGDGILVDRAIVSTFEQVVSQNHGGRAFAVLGGTSVTWLSTYAISCAGAGYHLEALTYSAFVGTACDLNQVGYLMHACGDITLTSCGAEAITGVALKIDGCSGVTATNFRNFDNRGGAIWVTGSSRGVKLITPREQNPQWILKPFSLQVDAGCHVRLEDNSMLISPLQLAPSTTVILSQLP